MAKTQLSHEISGGRAIGSRDAFRGTLRHYRRNLGISQQELANLAKVSQVTLSHFEIGRNNLSVDAFIRVQQALCCLVNLRAAALGLGKIDAVALSTDRQTGA
jgi:transcriptional regulator with XRE-family HTH domain